MFTLVILSYQVAVVNRLVGACTGIVVSVDLRPVVIQRQHGCNMHKLCLIILSYDSGFAALRNICGMSCGHRVKLQQISAELSLDINRLSELFEQGLAEFGGPFLSGKAFTAAEAHAILDHAVERGINVNCVLPSIIDTPANRADMPDADFSAWVQPAQLAAFIHRHAAVGAQIVIVDPDRGNRAAFGRDMGLLGLTVEEELGGSGMGYLAHNLRLRIATATGGGTSFSQPPSFLRIRSAKVRGWQAIARGSAPLMGTKKPLLSRCWNRPATEGRIWIAEAVTTESSATL